MSTETAGNILKVLLVEDNPADARLVQVMLTSIDGAADGYLVAHVVTLAAARTHLASEDVDVTLLDLSLPDGHGLQTFFDLHSEFPNASVIILSGMADEGAAREAVRRGAQDYLVKGEFNAHQIRRAVTYAVERRQLERERHRLEELLRQSLKMESVATLAGGVAHDLNNILTVIQGSAQLLQIKLDRGESVAAYVKNIMDSAQRAANLTQSLLSFSRKRPVTPRPVELGAFLGNLQPALERLLGDDIVLTITPFPEKIPVMIDGGLMEEVIVNMASNASFAMTGGGIFAIASETFRMPPASPLAEQLGMSGDFAVISISDTGVGMDAKTQERVFDPFFTTREVGKGAGLGMAVSYGIVKQHRGHVTVYSEPGIGTTFKIYLPLAGEVIAENTRPAEAPFPEGSAVILLAEDEPAVRSITRSILEHLGYRVIEAVDGDDAVQKFGRHGESVDLVLLDVMMPKRNGREALDAIRRLKPGVKAIFMSGYAADIVSYNGTVASDVPFISKPCPPEKLMTVISHELGRSWADHGV